MIIRNSGLTPIGAVLGDVGGLLDRIEAMRRQQRERIEAAARPGETYEHVAARFQREAEKVGRPTVSNQQPATLVRKPPKGDEQPDFFIPALREVGTRDSRSMMDVAVFRLSKKDKRAGEVIRYELPDGHVEVKAGPDGMASIWDYDIVLMLVSHLTEAMNRYREGKGDKPGRVFKPHVSDILKFCRKGDGARQFEQVEAALDRLKGTTIKSVREVSRDSKRTTREVKSEGLISSYEIVSRTDTGKVARVEIEAPNWIYREITEGKQPDVLTVHPDYFLIEPGMGRFVYRLARRAAGKGKAKWAFRTIYQRSGSAGTFKEFCRILRKLIVADDLPEYTLREEAGQSGPQLLMRHRSEAPDALLHDTAVCNRR
ncbi:TPA: replication initiator protein A [Burkholderia multivorans]|nr:replication initiator protein A [Burkholderia multivorans]MDN7951601.1 replication initiator protein A [Burkholderia multivorans]HEJ2440541.1 replication initiator protein A [Burkholderia multivorans]